MEDDFKVPTFEPKLKVVAKKPKPTDDNHVDELKETLPSEVEPVEAAKESEGAKCESKPEQKLPKCPYVEPKWSAPPESSLIYNFEVLKGGQIVDNVNNLQNKAFWTIGKLQTNDIAMAHPTISRYHAVLQYRPNVVNNDDNSDDDSDGDGEKADVADQKPKVDKGWYLYDLNSTHGSFVNKMKVPPKTYVRIRVGYMLKFGASTRNYILQGPGFDEEAESELTITEMKELRLKKQQEQQDKLLEEERKREEEGISWGMAEDAEEETDLSHNPFAATGNEELFLQDPKKTLRGYFEREGHNLEYKVDEVSNGTYVCRVELPITDSMGRSITAEFTHKGKKKECVAQCALEACRILDRNGLLRQANHEPRKRKVESSDDDDDEFYDRTAGAEEKRRRKAGNDESVALSYEQLLAEEQKLQAQLVETEERIERYQKFEKASKEKEAIEVDDLDDFMSGLSSEKRMDKADVRKCRFELQRIKTDIQRVQKLINVAKPIDLPPLNMGTAASDATQTKKSLPLFGKKRTFGFDKLKSQVATKQSTLPAQSAATASESVEEFDDDEDRNEISEKISKMESSNAECVQKAASAQTNNSDTSNAIKSRVASTQEIARESIAKEIPTSREREKEIDNAKHEEEKEMEIHENEKSASSKKDISSNSKPSDVIASNVQSSSGSNSSSGASNKQKSRNRQRNKVRHHIDVDDTEEDTSPQKYSGWMPPENQSGDGMTSLNSKYGY